MQPWLAFQLQRGAAADQQHPLIVGTVVPKPLRAALPVGDDALDLQAGARQQGLEDLLCRIYRHIRQQVSMLRLHPCLPKVVVPGP
ncbi:hypothetical protein D3C72_2335050 [compost metagenome]